MVIGIGCGDRFRVCRVALIEGGEIVGCPRLPLTGVVKDACPFDERHRIADVETVELELHGAGWRGGARGCIDYVRGQGDASVGSDAGGRGGRGGRRAAPPGRTWISPIMPRVFVLQNVAVVDKGSDDVGIAEVHAHLDAGIRAAAVPVRDVDGIADRGIVDRLAIDRENLEVNLVDMEDVIFRGAVLDDPVLDGARVDDDVRRLVHGEGGRRLALLR